MRFSYPTMPTNPEPIATRSLPNCRGQNGFSLVEVLVAAAVFSLGLAGLSLLLLNSVRGSAAATNRTTAAMHAASIAELILFSPAVKANFLNPPTQTGGNCLAPEVCSEAVWAASNLTRWRQRLEQSLPRGTGLVCLDSTPDDGDVADPACDGQGSAIVKVFWTERGPIAGGDSGRNRAVLPLAD